MKASIHLFTLFTIDYLCIPDEYGDQKKTQLVIEKYNRPTRKWSKNQSLALYVIWGYSNRAISC